MNEGMFVYGECSVLVFKDAGTNATNVVNALNAAISAGGTLPTSIQGLYTQPPAALIIARRRGSPRPCAISSEKRRRWRSSARR